MQGWLTDPDWRVGPNPVDLAARRHVGRCHHRNVAKLGCVLGTKQPGSLVHVDCPDGGVGISSRQRIADRAIAAAKVNEHLVSRGGVGAIEKQQLCSRVYAVGAEYTTITFKLNREIGKCERYGPHG